MSINIVHKKLSLLDAPLMPQKPNWISSMWWWHILNIAGWFFWWVCPGESKNINVLPKIENNLDCKIPKLPCLMEAYEVVWPWVSCVSIGWCFDAAQKQSIFSWVKFSFESKKTSDRNNFMKLVPKTKSNGSSVSKSTALVLLLLHDQKHKKFEMTDKVVMCLLSRSMLNSIGSCTLIC
jgi:hypothetical protein